MADKKQSQRQSQRMRPAAQVAARDTAQRAAAADTSRSYRQELQSEQSMARTGDAATDALLAREIARRQRFAVPERARQRSAEHAQATMTRKEHGNWFSDWMHHLFGRK